jgi:hypothetical protein
MYTSVHFVVNRCFGSILFESNSLRLIRVLKGFEPVPRTYIGNAAEVICYIRNVLIFLALVIQK